MTSPWWPYLPKANKDHKKGAPRGKAAPQKEIAADLDYTYRKNSSPLRFLVNWLHESLPCNVPDGGGGVVCGGRKGNKKRGRECASGNAIDVSQRRGLKRPYLGQFGGRRRRRKAAFNDIPETGSMLTHNTGTPTTRGEEDSRDFCRYFTLSFSPLLQPTVPRARTRRSADRRRWTTSSTASAKASTTTLPRWTKRKSSTRRLRTDSKTLKKGEEGTHSFRGTPLTNPYSPLPQRCKKIGGQKALDDWLEAQSGIVDWALGQSSEVENMEAKIERYKATGDLDVLFKEYCR